MTAPTRRDGAAIPRMMYGTAWKKDATAGLVERAVSLGFRAIDTANQRIHYDEAHVGDALVALARNGITRDQLFLQTKFTPVHGQDGQSPYDPRADIPTQVAQSFRSSLEHLHTDYVDSYVLHGPYSRVGLGKEDWEVWTAMEHLYQAGQAHMIGVSNVNAPQLQALCAGASVKPMVVQNRCYARLGWDRAVRDICRAEGMLYQGFSLLTANQEVWGHPDVHRIALRVGAGADEVILRFAIHLDMFPLTGTTNEQHMHDDLAVERFELTAEEVRHIEELSE